ncbi:MAG: hypothetical protein ACE5Q8_01845 [Nitrosopumilus sp.]|jgi:hypothetical protein
MGATAIVTGIGTGEVLSFMTVTQDTCPHDAKVKMAGYKDMYECTRCHKFIPMIKSKEIDHAAPQYLENSWEDD